MYIKSINNVVGYKGLPDGFNADFHENRTYIVGANFKGKSTIGSLFCWCLIGTTLNGKEKEQVASDDRKVSNVIVDITFVDNLGIEHRLIREKGKELHITLDGKEVEQGTLGQFYKGKDIFLVAHNPYYFWSLEPKEQKNIIRKLLPDISAEDAFNLLSKDEQEVIEKPIDNLNSYTERINEEIDGLGKNYNKNEGTIEILRSLALQQEGELLQFDEEQELNELQEKYNNISMEFGISNLEDLQRSINGINNKIQELVNEELVNVSNQYKREMKKLQDVNKEISICPACRQEIKNSETKAHLEQYYKKELLNYQEKANTLKEKAKKLTEERKEKQELYDKLNTLDERKLQSEKEKIKERIDVLSKKKNEVNLHNQEVQIMKKNVNEAKQKLVMFQNVQEEITKELNILKEQKKIANRLKILIIEKQKEMINKYLTKVNIEFSKINRSTGEITECCNIQYEGRDYKKLSKSQQARCCLEISNVFNNISGINAPIFFDDAESTTDIQEIHNTQLIISLVIKYNGLEILSDYEDVLTRKEASIRKEIEQKCCYEVDLAA